MGLNYKPYFIPHPVTVEKVDNKKIKILKGKLSLNLVQAQGGIFSQFFLLFVLLNLLFIFQILFYFFI